MKKLTVFILAALIAITCVSTALAADWVEIGEGGGTIQSVDVSSVRQTGGGRIVASSFGENYEWYMYPPGSFGDIKWHLGRHVLGLE